MWCIFVSPLNYWKMIEIFNLLPSWPQCFRWCMICYSKGEICLSNLTNNWGRFRWGIVSEMSNPSSSPVQPLVKSNLCSSYCFHRTYCHSCLVQTLCFKYSQYTIEAIQFFVCNSDILHWLSWCNYSIKLDDKLRCLRYQVCPELWC